MYKDTKLAEEEIIFSTENIIQNINFLKRDLDEGLEPKSFDFEINNEYVKVIVLNSMTVTSLMATFKSETFRLILNIEENIVLISPAIERDILKDDLRLEDYAGRVADYIFSNKDNFGNFGSKTGKSVKNFQLWNFYDYKLYLDL